MVEAKNLISPVFSVLHLCAPWHIHMYKHINTQQANIKNIFKCMHVCACVLVY